jgi:ABC-type uncharacterized transport system auxiliary subunit
MTLVRRLAPLLGAALLLGACAQGSPPPSEVFYRLDIPMEMVHPVSVTDPRTVEVTRFDAKGVLGDRAVAFSQRVDGQVLEQYSYHFWQEQPGVLLQTETVDYLRDAHAFARVVTPELRVRADLTIRGRVLRLEHLVPKDGAPAVALSMEMTLLDPLTDDVKVLATYTEVIPVAEKGVPAAVEALRDALARVLARFAADITKS